MLTTLTRVKTTIDRCGLSTTAFARVAENRLGFKLPQSSLSAAFHDKLFLGGEKEAALLGLVCQIERILEALRPLTIDRDALKAAETISYLLTKTPEEIGALVSAMFHREE